MTNLRGGAVSRMGPRSVRMTSCTGANPAPHASLGDASTREDEVNASIMRTSPARARKAVHSFNPTTSVERVSSQSNLAGRLNGVRSLSSEQYKALTLKKPSKFKNVWKEVDGIKFQSKREANRYIVLRDRQARGEIKRLERQVRYDFKIDGVLVCFFKADFRYWSDGEGYTVEDAKGFKTPDYIIKKKLMKALYHIDVVEV